VPSFIQRSEKESAQAEEIGFVKKSLWEQFSFGKAGETKDAQDDADLSIPTATGKSDNFASFNKEKIPVAVSGNGSEGRYGVFSDAKKSEADSDTQIQGIKDRKETASPAEGINRKKPCLQIHNAFIVEETDDGLNIIDQHALHEIINHEIKEYPSIKTVRQRLLMPELVELGQRIFLTLSV
jgi:DNA mismatch repair protein MutL